MTPRRILVVEDNPLNLKLVRDVLQFAGYTVIEAHSGEEGLRVAQEDAPDLVLMDLQLPGIDGTETLRRLRQGSLGRHVPVVAVTAFAMAEDRQRAALAGFDGFVEKPISVRALPGKVEAFLSGASEATGEISGASEATGRTSGASEATGRTSGASDATGEISGRAE